MKTVIEGDIKRAELLIKDGDTALSLAEENNHMGIANILRKHRASSNITADCSSLKFLHSYTLN